MARLLFKISLLLAVLASDYIQVGHAQECELIVASPDDFINTMSSTFEQLSCPTLESRLDAIETAVNNLEMALETAVSTVGSAVDVIQQQLGAILKQKSLPKSCADILASNSNAPSGMYEVSNAYSQNQTVYCDMTTECNGVRGWTRLAFLDTSDNSQGCPAGLELLGEHNVRFCRPIEGQPQCTSVEYPSGRLSYSSVCGRIRGHNQRTMDGFQSHGPVRVSPPNTPLTINSNYVDGVSLTYGSPRKHLWTFAAAHSCNCGSSPGFVGNDYFCDTGNGDVAADLQRPLWAGLSCQNPRCCGINNPPWFYKQLPSPTTEGIEMRLCRDQVVQDEDIVITLVEILVR